nr:MAG: MatK/TrnK amino terminal region [Bacteriophage sp.]
MNFNLVEMYNGLLRFNKHILNELAEGLKHLPNLDGVSKGDSLIINEQGNPAWGSTAFIHTIGLKVKDNYQIYPVDSRGINFVGYVFYHTHALIRKSIKYKIIRLVNSYLNREIDRKEFKIRMCAYYG